MNQLVRGSGRAPWVLFVGVILLGTGLFGIATGSWRSPLQGVFTGLKFPLIVLLTMLGTGLLNGMLAPLLGLDVGFKPALLAVMMSFAVMAAILGASASLMGFLVWNMPPMGTSGLAYRLVLLSQVAAIAAAGLAGNARLLQFLAHLSGDRGVAQRVFVAWLSVNLFLGAQLSWNLRPFIGSPGLPVQFLRPNAFEGNFFESVFNNTRLLLQS